MAPQMSVAEQSLVDQIMRQKGNRPMDALCRVNAQRQKRRIEPLHKSSVYRFVKGLTHARAKVDTRGRRKVLNDVHVKALQRARRSLIKKANWEHRRAT